MQGPRLELPPTSFPIRQILVQGADASTAAARNRAAEAARGELFVFLDADCAPHPALIDQYASSARLSALLQGKVATEGSCAGLSKGAVVGSENAAIKAAATVPDNQGMKFSPANFAIGARDFAAIGGFDENFCGPGGEEIDFARAAREAGLSRLSVPGAIAFRDRNRDRAPPVDQVDAVLRNTRLLTRKWKEPANEEWLQTFAFLGLIERTQDGWRKLREPNLRDLDICALIPEPPETDPSEVKPAFPGLVHGQAGAELATTRVLHKAR